MLSIAEHHKNKEHKSQPLLVATSPSIQSHNPNTQASTSSPSSNELNQSSPTFSTQTNRTRERDRERDRLRHPMITNVPPQIISLNLDESLHLSSTKTNTKHPKPFKYRRVVDNMMISICTCCGWSKIKKFRKKRPLCSYLLLYTILTFILAAIGGLIFHACEFDHENEQIDEKQRLYAAVTALIGDNPEGKQLLDELLGMCTVPLENENNRWRMTTATFFAFTTASTIGYGFTTPQTFWGRAATFLYGLPAICVFGLAMVQIGSAVALTVDKRIKHHERTTFHRIVKQVWYKRFCAWISIELRRTVWIFMLLMVMIAAAGGILSYIQDGWRYADGVYFMWISISTIGYGDLQPDIIETTLWANVIIWIGLAMTALVIGSAQDYFSKKLRKWRQEDMDVIDVNDLTLDLNGDHTDDEDGSDVGMGMTMDHLSSVTMEESRRKRRDNGDSKSTMSVKDDKSLVVSSNYHALNSPIVDDRDSLELTSGK